MPEYKLRPHHGLCIRFFEGKGYSDEFVGNMTKVISFLEETDPFVTLTASEDMICESCPERLSGHCAALGKAALYDRRVTEQLKTDFKTALKWSDFSRRAYEEIILSGKLREVCADCKWFALCAGRSKKIIGRKQE